MPGDMEFVHQLVEGGKCSISQGLLITEVRTQLLPFWVQGTLLVGLFRRLIFMRWL